jgi:hypothetical protein
MGRMIRTFKSQMLLGQMIKVPFDMYKVTPFTVVKLRERLLACLHNRANN